jgi:hypothetical protein
MKKYTHTFDICFSVNSDYSDETDCLRLEKNEVISASQGRIRNVFNDNEYLEAIGHVDTIEEHEEGIIWEDKE